MKVRFSKEAREDLLGIVRHIEADSPLRALEFVRRLRQRAFQIGDTPFAFPLVPHAIRAGLRRRVRKGYLIFYIVEDGTVTIVHVLHGAQDYEAFLTEQ